MSREILVRLGFWPLYVDIVQTAFLVVLAVAVIYIMLLIRNELRRSSGVMNAMSRAIGEQSDLKNRLDQMEDDVAHLAMEVDQMKQRNNH